MKNNKISLFELKKIVKKIMTEEINNFNRKKLLNESTEQVTIKKNQPLTTQEKEIYNDIMGDNTVNENINFNEVIGKVKKYVRKGLLTSSLLVALLNNNAFSQEQKDQIKNIASTEQSINQESDNIISSKDLIKLSKKEGYDVLMGTLPMNMWINKYDNFKMFKSVAKTQSAAHMQSLQKAGNPIKYFTLYKTLSNGNIEVMILVPAI
jgi:hypothetical protein